jgi:hypothetical protein
MVILKRLTVWLVERFVEALLFGALFGYLLLPNFRNVFPDLWRLTGIVAVVLFIHGYYVTTGLFGIVWRSRKSWVYPAIAAVLLVIHTRILFARAGSDFTPETRAMELPFAMVGACIAFGCSFVGSRVLKKWLSANATANPYLSAAGLALLVFALANTAHFLRPSDYDNSFRPYGLPFTFYRDGGFVGHSFVWQDGRFIWHGVIANAALLMATVVLLGTGWQRIKSSPER